MAENKITDWDDAYANAAHIPNGGQWPDAWVAPARKFRETSACTLNIAYGEEERLRYDLFLPTDKPRGLFVFIHGGYWLALDKSYWSHLAQGAVERGWAVAIPSYPLCPDVSIGEIISAVARAVEHAASQMDGPIVLSGHSAGGHLAASLICSISQLPGEVLARIKHVVPISGLHDLRPLMMTKMNEQFQLNEKEAMENSPVFHRPISDCPVTAWVGALERPEFIRQSHLLANIWQGVGADIRCVVQPDFHHFTVIDELADANSPLVRTCLEYRG